MAAEKEQNLYLYYFPLSFFSQKAQIALEELHVPYKCEVVNIHKYEQFEPWFVALNPSARVPILKDGDKVVDGAWNILKHLDENYNNGHKLFPSLDTEIGKSVCSMNELLDSIKVEVLTFGTVIHPELTDGFGLPSFLVGKMREQSLRMTEAFDSFTLKYPQLKEIYDKKRDEGDQIMRDASDKPNVEKLLDHVDSVMAKVDEQLQEQVKALQKEDVYLCGDHVTSADITLGITLDRLDTCGLAGRYWSTRPHIARYYNMITKRKSFKKACAKSNFLLVLILSFLFGALVLVGTGAFVYYLLKHRQ